MTLCNVIMGSGAASVEIFTDTRAIVYPTGDLGDVTKIHAVPHIGAVVCGQGSAGLLQMMAGRLAKAVGDFDAAIASVIEDRILDRLLTEIAALPAGAVPKLIYRPVAVGWSPAARRYKLWLFTEDAPGRFQAREHDGDLYTPWDGELGGAPRVRGLADMVAVAERQCALGERLAGAGSFGGELVRARLGSEGRRIELGRVHRFGARPAILQR